MNKSLNIYGDSPKFVASGHGADIASQRADDLDLLALEFVKTRSDSGLTTNGIDVACGEGGQTIRLAQSGAHMLAIDILDGKSLLEKIESSGLHGRIKYLREDMRMLSRAEIASADLIICQRAIHYLDYESAVDVVCQMRHLLAPGGHLYLSASGIQSELGNGYSGIGVPIGSRYAELSEPMRNKHDIQGPVCLYSESDISTLLTVAGFTPVNIFSSPFGNIKAVAVNEP